MRLKKKGFTLIELLVVIIIVGILAAVAVPIMTGQVVRAKKTEAVAALGTLKTAMTAYRAEYGYYPANDASPLDWGTYGLTASDFDGKYYNNLSYSWTNAGGGDSSLSATQESVSAIVVYMNMNGTITGDRL